MATAGPVLGFAKEFTSAAISQVICSWDHVGVTPGVSVWASIVQVDPANHAPRDDLTVWLSVLQVVPNYANFGADVKVNLELNPNVGTPPSGPTTFRVSLFVQLESPTHVV